MTESLYAQTPDSSHADKSSDQILRLAKDLDRLIISLEEQPCLNPGVYHRIACLRCDIISSIYNILAIYDVEAHP